MDVDSILEEQRAQQAALLERVNIEASEVIGQLHMLVICSKVEVDTGNLLVESSKLIDSSLLK